MHGTLSGSIRGRAVDFTINWDNGSRGRYVGQVNEDAGFAAATGTTGDSGWRLLGPLQCLDAPVAPVPAPEQVPLPRQGVPITLPPPQQAPPPPPPPGRPNDRDSDGLFDADETNVYGTNPDKADTDGDGADDGQEVFDGTDPLDPNDP
jgi:hypothetical protein